MEACHARCYCWDFFPDLGGQIIGEVNAFCYENVCSYGTLKTSPFCCSKNLGHKCWEMHCNQDGICCNSEGKCDPPTTSTSIEIPITSDYRVDKV